MQQLLGEEQLAQLRAAGPGAGFSGLAVTVLRRVLRVAASARMASDAKTAVVAYAAGNMTELHTCSTCCVQSCYQPRSLTRVAVFTCDFAVFDPVHLCASAGVLSGVLRLQAHAAPFATVCQRILESSDVLGSGAAQSADGPATAAEPGGTAHKDVQPLVSLHQQALAALGEHRIYGALA